MNLGLGTPDLRGDPICTDTDKEMATVKIEKVEINSA